MKDLSIEKLEERNTGNYHLKRKVNEIIEVINELQRLLQELAEPRLEGPFPADQDSSD